MSGRHSQPEDQRWQPPWPVHLLVWAGSLGPAFWLGRNGYVLVGIGFFVVVMIVYGLVTTHIQDQRRSAS